jgi:hypothetical protein
MNVEWKKEIKLSPELQAMIRNSGDKRGTGMAIAKEMDKQNELTVNAIQGKLSGPLLRVRRGHLRESISRTDAIVVADNDSTEVRATVGSNARFGGDSLAYAAPLEFGSKPHLIRPLPGRGPKASLRFIGRNGQVCFAKAVNHPGNRPYNYVRGTVEERLAIYRDRIGGAAYTFITGGTN